MRKPLIITLWGLLLTFGATAETIPLATARHAAERFIAMQRKSDVPVQLTLCAAQKEVTEMYLFNAADSGFVIVAADNCVRPILAYSESETLPDLLPEHVAAWLQGYAEEIVYLRSLHVDALSTARYEWDLLLDGSQNTPLFSTTVAPMLTTQWRQGDPYNTLCPGDSDHSSNTLAGCVAIAAAQVMKYWNHPAQGEGSYSYNHSTFGTQSANFGATTYDWSNMPNTLTSTSPATQINAVATLVYHVGVSVKMNYGFNSSGATTVSSNSLTTITAERALRTFFRYSKSLHSIRKDVLPDDMWMELLDDELLAGRPVIYSGHDTSGGHAFVLDGSNNSNMYHINWGWGGYCDGYYQIGALNPASGGAGGNATSRYNLNNKAIIGICPDNAPQSSHTVIASADMATHGSVSGGGFYNYGDTVSLVATAASGYRFAYWSDGMCYNPRDIIVGNDVSYTALYEPVVGDTLQYDNGPYITSWGYSTPRPYYWGVKFEPSSLTGRALIEGVNVHLKPGTYQLMIFNGTTPSPASMLDSLPYLATGDRRWHTITLPTPQPIDNTLPLWVVLYNSDTTYPACAGNYCGNASAAYANTNGTSWTPSDKKRTFMIRAILGSPTLFCQVTVSSDSLSMGTVSGGGQYAYGSTATLTAEPTTCHAFSHWSDGNTANPRQIMVLTDTTLRACFVTDTIVTVQPMEACDSLTWINNVTYTSSTTDTLMFLTTAGCDSALILHLTVHPSYNTVDSVTTCGPFLWMLNGHTYTESSIDYETVPSIHDCDSNVTLVLTIVDSTGINTAAQPAVLLYPNPTEGMLTLSDMPASVEVFDLYGRCTASCLATRQLDLSSLPAGVYTVRLTLADGTIHRQRVIKR